jgi:dihydroorotase
VKSLTLSKFLNTHRKLADAVFVNQQKRPVPTANQKRLVSAIVAAARRRGVISDLGNGGNSHLKWDVVERATEQGFWPDTLSTDWTANSRENPSVIDFPNVMSKFIMLGMPFSHVIACATVNAARVFPAFDDRGALSTGAAHDG